MFVLVMMFSGDPSVCDSLAEWSKALASGASPKGCGFEPHSCHGLINMIEQIFAHGSPTALGTQTTLFIIRLVNLFAVDVIPR